MLPSPRSIASAAALMLSAAALAQTGYSITGSMSNFDCTNRCDTDCDELEIQIEGAQPGDVIHTYRNGNYGSPTVTLSADGTYTSVDYRNPGHPTSVNSVEHYGVTLRGTVYYGPPAVYHPTRVYWYHNGRLATVHGNPPTVGGGTAPATQPMLPSITAGINPGVPGPHSAGNVSLTVKNNDTAQSIWVKRRATVYAGPVSLEALMPTDPVVTNAVQIDTVPIKLLPLQSLTLAHDLFELEEEQSAVFTAEYFQNVLAADPFDPHGSEQPGPMLGNVMTAQVASPANLGCVHHPASITTQPTDVTAAENARVDIRVQARGDDVAPLTYVWMKEGVVLANDANFSGVDSAHLRINKLTAATEGFYSVRVTNTCADILSRSALVFMPGHNVAPTHLPPIPCVADFDGSGGTPDATDIDAYFSAWLAGDPSADADASGGTPDATDIDLFFAEWLNGGC